MNVESSTRELVHFIVRSYDMLASIAQYNFRERGQMGPTFWLDKVCIDQRVIRMQMCTANTDLMSCSFVDVLSARMLWVLCSRAYTWNRLLFAARLWMCFPHVFVVLRSAACLCFC